MEDFTERLNDLNYRFMLTDEYNTLEEIKLSWDSIYEIGRLLPIDKRHELYDTIQHLTASTVAMVEKHKAEIQQ